ncbi:MAG: metallophosphoesterase [Propionibacteriaceae bacterium]|jgi:predicted MPP superfamily phosphohydrolase|nr:metallophosphoesterase [Propionibacteriaceae bacterium]
MKIARAAALCAASIGTVGLGCLTYAATVEVERFTLRHVTVPVLPSDHDPVRILHISDLHLLTTQAKKIAWVQALADLKPDFVVNTGDNIAQPEALNALVQALRPLSGTPGVFVFGSNDVYGPRPLNPLAYFTAHTFSHARATMPTPALRLVLEKCGWTFVEQVTTTFELNGSVIEVRGCGDAHMDADDYPRVEGPLSPDVDLLMGVTHAPYQRVLDAMTMDGAGLIMAGHTHGGQVCLPGGRALTTNCDLPVSQVKGLSTHRVDDHESFLHVSAGLGTSPYAPYRFFCPPEATVVTLVARQN